MTDLTNEQVALLAAAITSLRQPGSIVTYPGAETRDPVVAKATAFLHWLNDHS